MDNSYTAVLVLAIGTLLVGALVFGGSLWVYSSSNKQQSRPRRDGRLVDPDDRSLDQGDQRT